MAELQLSWQEAEQGLPAVCMCCGEQATIWKQKWIEMPEPELQGFFVFREIRAIFEIIRLAKSFSRPKKVVRAPFCNSHEKHWSSRKLIIVLGVAAGLILPLPAALAAHRLELGETAIGIAAFGVLIAGLLAAVIAHETSIQSTAVTEETITLKNVCDPFAQAVVNQRTKSNPLS